MVVAFFGHKDTPESVKPLLENAVRELIEHNDDTTFYVGTHGRFDGMTQSVLQRYSEEYPQIKYYVVLAYLSNNENDREYYKNMPTIYPEGIENSPPKYAISYRNKWIVQQADVVICYIKRDYGGAAQFVKYAKRRGKSIINLAETKSLS